MMASNSLPSYVVPRARVATAIAFLVVALGSASGQAQSLTRDLFERYVEALREQAGIPGLSVAVVQRLPRETVWVSGFGRQDVEANVPATPDTPYFIANLSQTFGAALTLRNCLEFGTLEIGDRVRRWVPAYPELDTTVEQLLTHATSDGTFRYDPDRFAGLTGVVVECADRPYRHLLVDEIFGRFAMTNSAPGAEVSQPAAPGNVAFSTADVARYGAIVRRAAPAYRVDRGRPTRSDVQPPALSASSGVVTTVNDLVRFDAILSSGALIQPDTLDASWTQASLVNGSPLPAGYGWFVQEYRGVSGVSEAAVWQFGLIPGGHSALMVKVPARGLTFIALANSDGLAAGYNLHEGNVTKSPFAKLFLEFFVR